MKVKSVTYYRTSSNGNVGTDKDSKKRQQIECQAYAKKNSIRIVKEFYDAGVMGKDSLYDRKGFSELLDYCESLDIKTILFESASRFSRDLITQETGYKILTEKGYKIIAVDNPSTFIEETPSSKMIRQILGSVSEFEKDNLVSKLRGARVRKRKLNKEKGIVNRSGKGKCEGRKSYQESNPELVKLVRRLRRKNPITGNRMSYNKISAELSEMGHMTKTGKKFGIQQIVRFLG